MAHIRALLENPVIPAETKERLRADLTCSADAALQHQEDNFTAKNEALNTAGKSYLQVSVMRDPRKDAVRKELADFQHTRLQEEAARTQKVTDERRSLTVQLEKVQAQLKVFDEETAARSAEWAAHYDSRAASIAVKLKAAEDAAAKAAAALAAAPSPHAEVPDLAATDADADMDGGATPPAAEAAGAGAQRQHQQHILPFIPPPRLTRPTDPAALAKLQTAKATVQLWMVQSADWPVTPRMLGMEVNDLAQLVGSEHWEQYPVLDTDAVLDRRLIGVVGVALTELEVSAAAAAAAQTAAAQAMEQQRASKCRKTE